MHKQTTISIIAIILGIIIIAFPMLGVITAADILGLSVLLLAIFLLANGVSEVEYNTTRGLINTILGIIMLIIVQRLFLTLVQIVYLIHMRWVRVFRCIIK